MQETRIMDAGERVVIVSWSTSEFFSLFVLSGRLVTPATTEPPRHEESLTQTWSSIF